MDRLTIFGVSTSPNVKRVLAIAYELGLDPEIAALDFVKGEHRSESYLALNPLGEVPTMVDDDGFSLWESNAMAWYLAERNPSKGLLPADLKGRADQMRWMFFNACHLEPTVLAIARERLGSPGQDADEDRGAAPVKELERYLPVLNAHLEGKTWLGGRISVADLCLGATLELCAAIGVDLAGHKHVAGWLARLQARPAWKRAGAGG